MMEWVSTGPNMYQIYGVPAPPKPSYAQLHGIRNINRAHPESDYAPAHFFHEPQVEVESSRGKFRLA
jgi:hypothetical protein